VRRFFSILLSGLATTALYLLPSAPAVAINEFQRIKAADAEVNDNFGRSVGLSGNTAIIGAWHDNIPGMPVKNDAGGAYIFRDSGSGTWTQIDKVFADDAAAGNMFGSSVAISGNTAIVGSPLRAGGGAAYIFRDNGAGDWVQIDRITADNAIAGDEFGYSVAIDGNTAVVGAWKRGASAGAAYVFRDNGSGDWTQIGSLTANDAAMGDQFGVSVAISGSTAMVGASFDANVASLAGAVYVFQEAGGGGGWSQADKLLPNDAALAKQFGSSVAMAGTTAVIGAIGDATGASSAGAAYVFQRNGSLVWQQQDKLNPSDPTHTGQFGVSVALSGNTALVGANQNSVNGMVTGSAYLFRNNGAGAWNQIRRLSPSDGEAGDWFGYSTGISGGTALVGSVLANDSIAGIDTGAGYLYHVPGPVLVGDFNIDGNVDGADYTVWRNTSGQTGNGLAADGNGDGVVNRADYNLWKRNYHQSPATGSLGPTGTVPEPGTALLLICAGLARLALPRRRK
jgi:hypothetical protein